MTHRWLMFPLLVTAVPAWAQATDAMAPLPTVTDGAPTRGTQLDQTDLNLTRRALVPAQGDGEVAEAREKLGRQAQIGVTCHDSRHLAMEAGEAGADYVAFGAFFASNTKTVTTPASLEILEWWSGLMEVPCVAIGGITVENCRPVIAAGADFLAVAGGVWNFRDGPKAAVSAFNEIFSANR